MRWVIRAPVLIREEILSLKDEGDRKAQGAPVAGLRQEFRDSSFSLNEGISDVGADSDKLSETAPPRHLAARVKQVAWTAG